MQCTAKAFSRMLWDIGVHLIARCTQGTAALPTADSRTSLLAIFGQSFVCFAVMVNALEALMHCECRNHWKGRNRYRWRYAQRLNETDSRVYIPVKQPCITLPTNSVALFKGITHASIPDCGYLFLYASSDLMPSCGYCWRYHETE